MARVWINTPYQPDVTSYDYDSAIDESGRPGTKYFPFRDAIAKATGVTPPPVPVVDPPIATPPVEFKESASLWQTLPQPFASEQVVSMEDLNQAYGYILYRTTFPARSRATWFLTNSTTTRKSTRMASCWERSTGGSNKIVCTSI